MMQDDEDARSRKRGSSSSAIGTGQEKKKKMKTMMMHDDEDARWTKRGSSSSAIGTGQEEQQQQQQHYYSGRIHRRRLLYRRKLTHEDVSLFKMVVPLEAGRRFLDEPEKVNGKYVRRTLLLMDKDEHIWPMEVSFQEATACFVIDLNWDKYFRKYGLKAGDLLFLFCDPFVYSSGHFLIECQKKGDLHPH